MTKNLIIDSEKPSQASSTEEEMAMLGSSPAMQKARSLALKVAPTDSNILITGETGTGKEMLARFIHEHSRRRDRAFVAVNASAIPENLQESELFGYRKGAFTGALSDRKGLFEEADTGTLFLDEIGDVSLNLQVKLLRALENRVIRRLGEGGERRVDIRIIAATNRDLVALVRQGEFREDLFFRLNVVHLHLSPLHERGKDVEMLLKTFLRRYTARHGKAVTDFDKEVWTLLNAYSYPGNIRELDNLVHHAVLMSEGSLIRVADLPPYLLSHLSRPRLGPALSAGFTEDKPAPNGFFDLEKGFVSLAQMEKALIQATLRKLEGNQSVAAKKLGISRSTLWRKIKEYGMPANPIRL